MQLFERVSPSDIVLLHDHGSTVKMTAGEAGAVADRFDPETFPEGNLLKQLLEVYMDVIARDEAGACFILLKIVAPKA